MVKFIQTDSQSRLMDSPRITTMDNKEAVLESTQRIYWSEGSTRSYSTSSDYYTDNIKNEDVGIKITLTPRINNKGYVILTVEEEQQAVNGYTTLTTSGRDNQFPNLTTRKMGADVAVQSGDTIVLGGLAENSTSRTRKKIPFLGDIPLLGRLFSSDKEERRRTELLVFISPFVVDTPPQVEDDARNAKASLDTRGVWDATWSRSRLADPVPSKIHRRVLENGRQTVLPFREQRPAHAGQPCAFAHVRVRARRRVAGHDRAGRKLVRGQWNHRASILRFGHSIRKCVSEGLGRYLLSKFQLTYKIQGLSPAALETGRHLVTSVNGESVDTVQSASMTRTIDVPAGQLHDGLNEITLGFDTLAQSLWGNIVLFRVEMTECEEDKDRGAVIIIK